MRKVIVAAASVLLIGSLLAVDTSNACAEGPCWEKECDRNTTCGSPCPSCNAPPMQSGVCWY